MIAESMLHIEECPNCKGEGWTDGWHSEEPCYDCETLGIKVTGELADPIMRIVDAMLARHCRRKHP